MLIKCWIREKDGFESNFILNISKVRNISMYKEGGVQIHFNNSEIDYWDFIFKEPAEARALYASFGLILNKDSQIESGGYFTLQRLGD